MTRSAAAVAAILLFTGLCAVRAAAQTPPARVEIALPACPSDAPWLRDALGALRVELAADGVDEVARVSAAAIGIGDATTAVARIGIATSCGRSASSADVTIDDPLTRKHVARTVDVSDVAPDARGRALALGVAELLRASWAELSMPDVPAARMAVPSRVRAAALARVATSVGESPAPSGGDEAWLDVGLGARGSVATGPVTPDLGAELWSSWRPRGAPMTLDLAAHFAYAHVSSPGVVVRMFVIGGSLGASARVALAAGTTLGLGPRVVVDAVVLEGETHVPGFAGVDATDVAIVAAGVASLRVALGDRAGLDLALEGGWAVRGVAARVEGERLAGVADAVVTGRAGLSLRW